MTHLEMGRRGARRQAVVVKFRDVTAMGDLPIGDESRGRSARLGTGVVDALGAEDAIGGLFLHVESRPPRRP